MKADKQVKPEPVVVQTICSMCSLPWEQHGEDPTTEDCIRLLKAELAKRPTVGYPVQPWRYPGYVYPHHYVYGGNLGTAVQPNAGQPTITCRTARTPRLAEHTGVGS